MPAESLDEHVADVLAAATERLPAEEVDAVLRVAESAREAAWAEGRIDWEEPSGALLATRRLFTEAALRGERRAAVELAEEALRAGTDLRDLYVDLLQASQYEVGRRWQANEISVAQEHMATAVTQVVMTGLYRHLEAPAERRGKAVVTGVEGELHQLGAHMVADMLEADGWDVRFLGTQMPHAGILDVIAEEEPSLVGISATIVPHLPAVRALISDLEARFGDRHPAILVGGGAFRSDERLWREVGADGTGSDLREAVAAARELAG